jgi:hypothetical protein
VRRAYHLYTYTQNQLGEVGWDFFGTAQIGDVFGVTPSPLATS